MNQSKLVVTLTSVVKTSIIVFLIAYLFFISSMIAHEKLKALL